MESKRGFDRFIAVLTLIVAIIAAYYAYKSYSLAGDSQVSLKFYMISGDSESNTDSIKIDPTKIKHDNGFMVFELPIKVINISETDSDKIIIYLGPESGENYKLELIGGGCGWYGMEWLQKQWYILNIDHMSPLAELNSRCILIRVKEGTKEIKLSWHALASHMLPTEGSLVLYF